MRSWHFRNPVDIRFGYGCVEGAFTALAQQGWRRLLLLTTKGLARRGKVEWLRDAWEGFSYVVRDDIDSHPELDALESLSSALGTETFDAIVAMGGGSVLDTAKVIALLHETGPDFSLREHFIGGRPLPPTRCLPVVAIPTTAGTGSEVTPFATVWHAAERKKYSLNSSKLFPRFALVDSRLTSTLPWETTLFTGLDALCQGMESVWNRNADAGSLELALRAVGLAWGALQEGRRAMEAPKLRHALMEGSLMAGLAISQTRTALCHSISYPITARFGMPHGLACGFTLPAVLNYNLPANDGRLNRLAHAAGCADPEELVVRMEALLQRLEVPRYVATYLPSAEAVVKLAPEMITPGRADNNLRAVGAEDVAALLGEYLNRFLGNEPVILSE